MGNRYSLKFELLSTLFSRISLRRLCFGVSNSTKMNATSKIPMPKKEYTTELINACDIVVVLNVIYDNQDHYCSIVVVMKK